MLPITRSLPAPLAAAPPSAARPSDRYPPLSPFVYTWQSNGTSGSILAAIILHASINTFSELDPWGSEQYPNFLAQPNSWYALEIYVVISLLLWTEGPALGRLSPKRVFA